MLLVRKRYGMLLVERKLIAVDEPGIYLWEMITVPSMSIMNANG